MFRVLHWAVVGFGNGIVGSFQSKKKDKCAVGGLSGGYEQR